VPLVPYRAMIFFPGGDPAAGALIDVRIIGSNLVPSLFSDAAGTIPLALPLVASTPAGNINFYAAPGSYWAELTGTLTAISVDPAYVGPTVIPDTYVHEQTAPSNLWTIDHHLGIEPDVDIVLPGGAQVESFVQHPTTEQTVISLSAALTGRAYLRR
jgi:hypothetical protein